MSSAEVVTAVAAVGATIVSILAVVVATRSASAAEKSADVAKIALHRGAIRDLIAACHELIAEELRVQSLANELRSGYTTLAVFTGGVGGSVEKELKGKLEVNVKLAAEKCMEARSLVVEPKRLIKASDDDLDQMHARIESGHIEIRNIREAMTRDLEDIGRQNQAHRDQR